MSKENFKQLLNNVKAFVFDIDGVLTDGSVLVLEKEEARTMNLKDGYALKAAVDAGYKVFVISGSRKNNTEKRLKYLGVEHIYFSVKDKQKKLKEVITKNKLKPENVLYMGDDVPDYEAMKMAGIAACPADAASEIRGISIYVSDKKGGKGCVRDVIEQVMRLQGKWYRA
jgi:3-deoxy-D-manno-octulosonate 8-phosphate phosphatase (KDO 8-P phosphatase)